MRELMDEEEFDLPKSSPLIQMMKEELDVHSVESLKERIKALKAEIIRTEQEINNKGSARETAEDIFKS